MSNPRDPAPLPEPLTRFIGRTHDIAAVAGQLGSRRTRLLTLSGPGGVGKTRLALRIAERSQERFTDGAVFVPLSAVRDPALVLPTLVQALGIEGDEGEDPTARLRAALHQREMLLVLDNLEQVAAAKTALGELLSACPTLSMLVTSRIPLRLSGEQVFPVSPFPMTDVGDASGSDLATLAAADAVALFVDRAAAAYPTFALIAQNAADVVAICRHTDGLPLAIELAAARLRLLSPGELAARLDRRLPMLAGGPRDRPDRLQTMRAAIAWSYDLLEPEQQALFRWLSVFEGGFGISAVEAIGGWPLVFGSASEQAKGQQRTAKSQQPIALDLLGEIVDASLVQRGNGPAGEARFIMLETIREFGLEQLVAAGEETPPSSGGGLGGEQGAPSSGGGLGGEKAARAAHASWCVAFAEGAGPHLSGPDHLSWWNRIAAELGNIRGAHAWLLAQGDAEQALRLGSALAWFWSVAGFYGEGRALFRQLIELPGANGWPSLLIPVLSAAANFEHWLANLDEAEALYRRQLELSRNLGDNAGIVGALRALGSIAVDRDDVDAASRSLAEGQALAADSDATWDAAAIANLQGIVAFARGDYKLAAERSEVAIQDWQSIDDTGHVAAAQINQARALLALGETRRSAEILCRVLAVVQAEVGDDTATCDGFEVSAGIATAAHDPFCGAQLLAAADAMLARMGILRRPPFQAFAERLSAEARTRLGDAAFAAAWAEGALLPLSDAIAMARAVAAAARPGQPAARPPVTGFAALTTREREVLRLVASGRSDKEIAVALGITRFTASNHVSNIRTKLGSSSRAAVAALAVRDGLL